MFKNWFLLVLLGMGMGCKSNIYDGKARAPVQSQVRVYLAPIFNATDDEHAGRALTEMIASALVKRGVPMSHLETSPTRNKEEEGNISDGYYLEKARSLQATHALIGTVHEYRYKTDLNGDPAVGLSLRLVDAHNGRTLWQASGANGTTLNMMSSTLSIAAQKVVKDLVKRMPLPKASSLHSSLSEKVQAVPLEKR